VLLAFLSAGYAGIGFVAYVLPWMANTFTAGLYGSGEAAEADPLRAARALVAQGNYAAAVEAFRQAAGGLEGNRIAWLEMVRLQREHLEDNAGAAATLREALEGHAWSEEDGGFLMFRLAEIYAEGLQDEDAAAEILVQLIGQFPETRHGANARHRLQQWGRMAAAP
jgi:TolA-binding protein